MKRLLILCCIATVAALVVAQTDEGYQVGRVIAFERVPADAQHPEKADSYKMSIRVGDVIYNCKANAPVTVFNDWTTGKEFPTRVNPKTLMVKNFDGHDVELTIVNKKKPK